MENVSGYLECNGTIVKITSFDDIKEFVFKYGKSIQEISKTELIQLTQVDNNTKPYKYGEGDYINNPLTLVKCKIDKFTTFKIQDNTIVIAKGAFDYVGCFGLQQIKMPDTVIAIGKWAFRCIDRLDTIYLSNSLSLIGEEAFLNCQQLTNMELPDSLRFIQEKAFLNTGIKKITIPKSVVEIGDYAFAKCGQLASIVFHDMPERIGSGIFDQCPIKEIKIPKGMKDKFTEEFFYLNEEIFIEEK